MRGLAEKHGFERERKVVLKAMKQTEMGERTIKNILKKIKSEEK